MKYQVTSPVKVGKPGRIIKPGDKPQALTEQEVRDAQGFLVAVEPPAAKTRNPDSSGKGDGPGPQGSGESSKNTPPPKGEGPVDLNTADKAALVSAGLSSKAAGAVIGHRKKLANAGQRFESVDQLTAVHGIGEAALAKARERLMVTEA